MNIDFRNHIGVGGRTFGRNKHLENKRITDVVSELTGLKTGRVIEHGDGRVDAEHQTQTLTISAEQVWGSFAEGRAYIYNLLREQGHTHESAMRRMTRERF